MGPSILLVDDDSESTSVLKLILEAEGYEAETAATATEAYAKVEKARFDLVLLDYILPDAKGSEAVGHIRKASPGIRVVLLSGIYSDSAEEMKYDAVMQKPVRPEVLLGTIKQLI